MAHTEVHFLLSEESKLRFECAICGRSYKWYANLITHIKYLCGAEPKFRCKICEYRSKWKGNVVKHIQTAHKLKDVDTIKSNVVNCHKAGSQQSLSSSLRSLDRIRIKYPKT
ncbi:unnamed protein product [Bemisia tabaci]|uniref:C2H2-type domain-containing protein n=1 Tax=Bemisia tabaci TaxID=7038 RepID=A0A9N9ZZS2_BEMTA|nr:unnamed protein product [Bemisia tabaci]